MEKINWAQKLTSRKFWVAVAFFLSSVGAQVQALQSTNPKIQALGLVTGIIGEALSVAIYSDSETKVDVARIKANEHVSDN